MSLTYWASSDNARWEKNLLMFTIPPKPSVKNSAWLVLLCTCEYSKDLQILRVAVPLHKMMNLPFHLFCIQGAFSLFDCVSNSETSLRGCIYKVHKKYHFHFIIFKRIVSCVGSDTYPHIFLWKYPSVPASYSLYLLQLLASDIPASYNYRSIIQNVN